MTDLRVVTLQPDRYKGVDFDAPFWRMILERAEQQLGIKFVFPSTPPAHVFDDDLIPQIEPPQRRPEDGDMDRLLETITIVDVYTKLGVKGFTPNVGSRREGIMIRCPDPAHADEHPSAWITLDKGKGGLYCCGACGFTGGDKYDLAAFHYGYDVPGYKTNGEFREVKRRLAAEFGYSAAPTGPAPHPTEAGGASAGSAEVGPRGEPRTSATPTVVAEPPPRVALRGPHPGGWLLGAPTDVPAIWGKGEHVLMARGEPLMVTGQEGLGKTTVVQQLALCRAGLQAELFRFPVEPDARKVLYIAADRPQQAARSFRRMVCDSDKPVLDNKLVFFYGALADDLGTNPEAIVHIARDVNAGTVVLDSLKDFAVDLSSDETGSRVARAIQLVISEGIEVIAIHHQRKTAHGRTQLVDSYGSRWLTAVCGSVITLEGDPGDVIVRLVHQKQPAATVGPLKLMHDHERGRTTVYEEVDPVTLIEASANGMTAREVAMKIFDTSDPGDNQIEAARRRLKGLVSKNLIREERGRKGGAGGGNPTRFLPLVPPDVATTA